MAKTACVIPANQIIGVLGEPLGTKSVKFVTKNYKKTLYLLRKRVDSKRKIHIDMAIGAVTSLRKVESSHPNGSIGRDDTSNFLVSNNIQYFYEKPTLERCDQILKSFMKRKI